MISLGALAQDPPPAPPAPPPPPPGISEEDLKTLAKDLEETAAKWQDAYRYKGNWVHPSDIDPAMDRRLAATIYGEASVSALKACLQAVKAKDPVSVMYITNRLLEPLARANPETVKAMLPTVKGLYDKYQYKIFPVINDFRPFQIPAGVVPLPKLKEIADRQDKKMGREWEVLRHNEQVRAIGVHYFRSVIQCNEPQLDKVLIDLMVGMEARTVGGRPPVVWLDVLDALSRAPMDEARAAAILRHTKLMALEETLYIHNKAYLSGTKATILPDAATVFMEEAPHPSGGIRLTNMLNNVRKVAKQPQRNVPTQVEVQHYAGPLYTKLTTLNKQLTDAMRPPRNNDTIASLRTQIATNEAIIAAMARCAGAEVTREQFETITKRAENDAKVFVTARGSSQADYDKALANFGQQIHDSVLTREQQDKIKPKPVDPPPPAQ